MGGYDSRGGLPSTWAAWRGASALAAAFLAAVPVSAGTLKECFDRAGPAQGYDRYVVLETGVTYTGGLWIGPTFNRISGQFEGRGESVRIVGNGAILDLEGGEITLAYCDERLDLDDCVIVGGNVRFRGYDGSQVSLRPTGSVRYVTFWRPHDYAVRLFHSGPGIQVERCLVVDAVDTGPDFMYLNGEQGDLLPTGASFALSLQVGGYELYDNWSWHSDSQANTERLRHFVSLCDYG